MCLSFFSLSFSFTLWSAGTAKSTVRQVLFIFFFFFFFFFFFGLGLVVWPRLYDPLVDQNPREVCAFHFPERIYHLFEWSNLNFLHNSQLIILPTQSCLTIYSLCANLLYSFIMRMIVSSLSPHNLHLLFCFVLLMSLFCAAIQRVSVSLSYPCPSFQNYVIFENYLY